MTEWYFAYGSNMQRATLCGRRGITCHRAIGARATGWRVSFDKPPLIPIGESFANLVPDPAATAFGVAYEIDATDLEHLDLTEGVLIGNYDRVRITVALLHGEECVVQAHTLTSERRDAALRPSSRYMRLVIEGAEQHGLPAHYVDYLRRVPTGAESVQARLLRPMMDALMRRR